MRRLLRLAVIAAADAAAKFALERKGQKVLNVKLYETGYTFTNRGDKEKKPQTLREISGCSFGKKRDNGRRELTLVEDNGRYAFAWHCSRSKLQDEKDESTHRIAALITSPWTCQQASIALRYFCQG